VIEIMDSGNSARSFQPLVPDASQSHLWFLRRLGGRYGHEPPGTDTRFGIVDPEDVQPIELKAYFQCYFSDDPEKAVRERLQVQPDVADRAVRYLTHREIERVMKIPDAGKRVERLIPYWLARYDWGYVAEAQKGIVDAGEVAGPYLNAIYETRPDRRQDVIRIWGDIRYHAAVPKLISLLQAHDDFWSRQTLDKGWWNRDGDPELMRLRRDVYCETYGAVTALHAIGDRSAIDVIRKTHARWSAIKFENGQIVEDCEAALKSWNVTTQPSAP
jgi:hypothetical protein